MQATRTSSGNRDGGPAGPVDAVSVVACEQSRQPANGAGEEGFLLIGAVVAIFIVLLLLSIAAPKIATALKRDKEVEAAHRANQYVMGIRRYYAKFGHYPSSVDQLEKSNNVRFLRQKYADPLTGKPDWRIIHVGENKTTVKGLFGAPLAGLAGGLGAAAGLAGGNGQTVNGGGTGSGFGTPIGGGSSSFGGGSSSFGGASGGIGGASAGAAGSTGAAGTNGATATSGSSGSSGGTGSSNGFGGGGPIMGVGSSKSGDAIVVENEQTSYQTWEFLYDPRIEQLKAKSSLFGGVSSGAPSTGLGTGFGGATGATPGAPGAPGTNGVNGTPGSTGTPGTTGTPATPGTTPPN